MPFPRRAFLEAVGLTAVALTTGQLDAGQPARREAIAPQTKNATGPDSKITRRAPANPSAVWESGVRGMTAPCSLSDQDVAAFAATGGAVLRLMFCPRPLRDLAPPYDLNQAAFTRLDELVTSCRNHDVKIILDPHSFPGLTSRFTSHRNDPFWHERKFQDLAAELWSSVAERYRDAGDVIIAYDLLNEPGVPDIAGTSGLGSWNALAERLVGAVRKHDATRPVIIEAPVGIGPGGRWFDRFSSMRYLLPPPDSHTIVSSHMYAPSGFAFQGLRGSPSGVNYPGSIGGQYWNKAALQNHMAQARAYQEKYDVPIYIGEFGAVRWSGAAGVRYLGDLIELFETFGWSWTYHAWRENQTWDAEMGSDRSDTSRHASTPRLELLKRSFAQKPAQSQENRVPEKFPQRPQTATVDR